MPNPASTTPPARGGPAGAAAALLHDVAPIGAALAALVSLAYARCLWLGETFLLRDHLSYGLPARAHLARSLAAGHLPQWWSEVALGVPYAANPNHGLLYPLAWPMALLPVGLGSDAFLVAHVWLAGLGCALLSRRWGASRSGAAVAGASLMLGGYVASVLVNHITVVSLAWVPWTGWAADRLAHADAPRARVRAGVVTAAVLALCLASGDPTGAILAGWIALAVVSLGDGRRARGVLDLALAGAGAVVLAAAALLPAVSLLGDSDRAAGALVGRADAWSLHPWSLLEALWPAVLGDPANTLRNAAPVLANAGGGTGVGASWALSVYVGAPAVLLALVGVRERRAHGRALALVALAFVVVALGRYTPVYAVYRAVFLPEHVLRYPAKYLAGALVLGASLAGVGFTRLHAAGASRRLVSVAAGWTLALGAALVALATRERALTDALAATLRAAGSHADASLVVADVTATGLAALVVAALTCAALLLTRRDRLRGAGVAVLAVVALGDLVFRVWQLQPLSARAPFLSPPAMLAEPIARAAEPKGLTSRVLRPRELMPEVDAEDAGDVAQALHATGHGNSPAPWGVATFPGYAAARSAHMDRLSRAIDGDVSLAQLLALFDVGWAVLPAAAAEGSGLRPVATSPARDLVTVETARRRPRAFFTPCASWFPTDEALLRDLLHPAAGAEARGLATVRFVGEGASTPAAAACPASACAVTPRSAERVDVRCRADAAGWAVLLDAYAPGWTATLDGVAAPIARADEVVRAVAVPPGEHLVRFTYRTPGLAPGVTASALGAAIALLLLAWARPRTTPAERC